MTRCHPLTTRARAGASAASNASAAPAPSPVKATTPEIDFGSLFDRLKAKKLQGGKRKAVESDARLQQPKEGLQHQLLQQQEAAPQEPTNSHQAPGGVDGQELTEAALPVAAKEGLIEGPDEAQKVPLKEGPEAANPQSPAIPRSPFIAAYTFTSPLVIGSSPAGKHSTRKASPIRDGDSDGDDDLEILDDGKTPGKTQVCASPVVLSRLVELWGHRLLMVNVKSAIEEMITTNTA